ncbi:RNA-binding S4 domain-containing protein [Novosphingobium piscinae]|uniref:RNA-binding S4 domain-containing protein n=1 Tax=Novosphingobium piscinae TaxID=1507448 RepID=A0A7X1FZX5_9SPHN|nr:RNA-binding S4 domain-containing protein [Novosphingobium piscinae]MBC2670075.1 RNA-binding S4 domain-containing protein [Novosphingobium piscinae]
MRLDKLLWFLRFARTRPLAQALVAAGHIRLNGRRVERSALAVRTGDILVLPLPAGVRVIEILALPGRRGPALEAQACYRVLDGAPANPIAAEPAPPASDPDRPEQPGDHSS